MKKGTRICAAGLLALTVALGAAPALGAAAPATALAAEDEVTVQVPGTDVTLGEQEYLLLHKDGTYAKGSTTVADLGTIQGVVPGDTLYLGKGTYQLKNANYNGEFTIVGAGADKTTIEGSVNFNTADGGDEYTVSISGVKMSYSAFHADKEAGIAVAGNDVTLDLKDCEFAGYQYAVKVETGAKRDAVSMDNVKLTNVWTAVSLNERASLGDVALAEGSEYTYAVEDYTADGKQDLYYSTFEDYRAGENAADAIDDDGYFVNPGHGDGWTYHKVASIGSYNYDWLNDALGKAKKGDTVEVVADAESTAKTTLEANDVTVEGNGHLITVNGGITVGGDNFTLQNAKVNGTADADSALFTFDGNGYEATLRDVALNNVDGKGAAFMAQGGAKIVVAGNFDLTPFMGSSAKAAIEIDGDTASRYNGIAFAEGATVTYNDVSWKNIPFAYLDADDKGVLPTVSANGSIVVDTQEFDSNKDGVTDYALVYVSMKAPEAQDAEMTRLYNPYTGEHLYTSDADEVQALVTMGWNDEGAKWVAPAEGAPVYRLYNPYSDEHHYTTDENEYAGLAELGWKQEGVKFYSADETGAPVYRLFNPYATRYTHVFTTDGNEAAELQKLGWQYEGVGFYGVK